MISRKMCLSLLAVIAAVTAGVIIYFYFFGYNCYGRGMGPDGPVSECYRGPSKEVPGIVY